MVIGAGMSALAVKAPTWLPLVPVTSYAPPCNVPGAKVAWYDNRPSCVEGCNATGLTPGPESVNFPAFSVFGSDLLHAGAEQRTVRIADSTES